MVSNLEKDERAILRLHARERKGHLKGDADLVTPGIGSTLTVVENGRLETKTRMEILNGVSNYFIIVKYSDSRPMHSPRFLPAFGRDHASHSELLTT